jgi:hypothetical protein
LFGLTFHPDFRARTKALVCQALAGTIPAVIVLALACLASCTDVSIAMARHQMRSGDYAAAHRSFGTVVQSTRLSSRERRQAMDGLCRTEYEIGAPTYPPAHLFRTCSAAVKQPQSESGPIFSDLEARERAALSATINAALAQPDLARADSTILRYQMLPDHDPEAVTAWTRKLWEIANRQAISQKRATSPAIGQLSHQYPGLKGMDQQQFRQWVEQLMMVSGTPIASSVAIGKHTVDLSIDDAQLDRAALNLDRFVRVNDGLVARCRCDGRTQVSVRDSGLPAYLVRLDPESHQSEVIILNQP